MLHRHLHRREAPRNVSDTIKQYKHPNEYSAYKTNLHLNSVLHNIFYTSALKHAHI
jgi:hypothetical protein